MASWVGLKETQSFDFDRWGLIIRIIIRCVHSEESNDGERTPLPPNPTCRGLTADLRYYWIRHTGVWLYINYMYSFPLQKIEFLCHSIICLFYKLRCLFPSILILNDDAFCSFICSLKLNEFQWIVQHFLIKKPAISNRQHFINKWSGVFYWVLLIWSIKSTVA